MRNAGCLALHLNPHSSRSSRDCAAFCKRRVVDGCHATDRVAPSLEPAALVNPVSSPPAATMRASYACSRNHRYECDERHPELFTAAGQDLRAFLEQSPISVAAFARDCFDACNNIH